MVAMMKLACLWLTFASAAATYSYVMFELHAVRDSWADIVQLSEFRLYNQDGTEIAISDADNPGGDSPSGEDADKAIDGWMGTKWLDFNEGNLVFTLASPTSAVGSYDWATANDETGRDPTRWTCLLYTSPSPRDRTRSRMPSSA